MEAVKVGGETSAYCTSCRDMRLHVVVAMEAGVPAKVECRSCHRQHKYRAAPPGTKTATKGATRRTAAAKSAAAAPAAPTANQLEVLLESRSDRSARTYSPSERFAVGELLSHPSFGLGAVTGTPSPGKIAVLFRDTTRLLLHERTSVPTGTALPRLSPPPPRREEHGPSDRPPKLKSVL